jgi:FAD/FMN-containing dehydrogenase/Fe-S oxidoreductase
MLSLPDVSELPASSWREIPFNYTSADDRQAIAFLLGPETVRVLDELRSARVTGRSARRLMRIFGDVLIHRRNPYLFQELIDFASRRRRFFENIAKELDAIARGAKGDQRVLGTLDRCRELIAEFQRDVEGAPELRNRIRRELGAIVGGNNVLFDPFSLVSHATDATDWRLFLPLAVVTPDAEAQVAPLLAAIGRLGLNAIPRGAGTGLTGGAVPLRSGCVVVNTERLNHIRGISQQNFQLADGRSVSSKVIEVEAGVVTESAMEYAAEQGQVFATDPTSAWASTIGGNIAENAGGKQAVRWGTCIDNLLEWRMAMPSGQRWTVRRTNHHLRKILPQDLVTFDVLDEQDAQVKRIELRGTEIRKNGLWKDITNKALGGLPGMQKEGTDGVITSAKFVLYPKYAVKQTLCLEFFGPDFDEASCVIVELSHAFPLPADGEETLLALEHFDDEYIRAIGYKVKAARAQTPRAVLLIDVGGDTAELAGRGVERIRALLQQHSNTILFVARDAAEAQRFWADRKKLGAIARRTNAFKMNEDIVLPLDALAEFAHFVNGVNIEEERYSHLLFARRAEEILATSMASEDAEETAAQLPARVALCASFREQVQGLDAKTLRSLTVLQEFRHNLERLMRGYPAVLEALKSAHHEVRDRRIVLATHMHAGDGNVHVNVPVLSNDQPMLGRAYSRIDEVMAKVIALGGVVSGEHGIGITKLKYLEPERIKELTAYRREVDPGGLMNPGKLEDYAALDYIFTPSFNLLELEARILQHGQLEELSHKIAHCVRCGKCKPNCCVYHPARGMFFHPRNKNLAIGSLIEALLYDTQRKLSTSFDLLPKLEEVADHCTICHKCLPVCPVDIDSGEVSVLEREILSSWGYKHTPLATKLSLSYLDSHSPAYNKLFRATVIQLGGMAQGLASKIAAPLQHISGAAQFYPLQMLRSPLPDYPGKTLRDVLPHCEPDQALVFEPAADAAAAAEQKTVLYFPGCGSERLFSDVSMAAIHLLLELNTRVVLPPPFLCCGFPAHVNAKTAQYSRTVLRDSILLTQICEMFSDLDFDACVVTCGTCKEGLAGMEIQKLYKRIVDAGAYLLERGLKLDGADRCLYHAPCHDSLDGKATSILKKLGGFGAITPVPHCCSEAGTLSLSRPDIADDMLDRKRAAFAEVLHGEKSTVLTNCPSCLQGLGRLRNLGIQPLHIVVALAEKHSGPKWKQKFLAQASRASAVSF